MESTLVFETFIKIETQLELVAREFGLPSHVPIPVNFTLNMDNFVPKLLKLNNEDAAHIKMDCFIHCIPDFQTAKKSQKRTVKLHDGTRKK